MNERQRNEPLQLWCWQNATLGGELMAVGKGYRAAHTDHRLIATIGGGLDRENKRRAITQWGLSVIANQFELTEWNLGLLHLDGFHFETKNVEAGFHQPDIAVVSGIVRAPGGVQEP